MTILKFKPQLEAIQGAYLLSSKSDENKIEMSFENVFPNGRISVYTVYVTFEVEKEVVNPDDSIDITINGIKYVKLVQVPTGVKPSGKDDLTFMAELIEDDKTFSIINKPSKMSEALTLEYTNPRPNRRKTFHVEPQQNVRLDATKFMHFYNKCPQGSDEFNVILGKGDSLYNPLSGTYRPMAIWGNNHFITLDKWGSYISNYRNGVWADFSLERKSTRGKVNEGHNQIFSAQQWWQQNKVGDQ